MKQHNEFDELARRKLEEREFPFQEAHWQEMEKLIDAGGRRKRWAGYWIIPALLFLLGGGAWIFNLNEKDEQKIAVKNDIPSIEKKFDDDHGSVMYDQLEQAVATEKPSIEVKEAVGTVENFDPSPKPQKDEVIDQGKIELAEGILIPGSEKAGEVLIMIPSEKMEKEPSIEENGSIEGPSVENSGMVADVVRNEERADDQETLSILPIKEASIADDLIKKSEDPQQSKNEAEINEEEAAVLPAGEIRTDTRSIGSIDPATFPTISDPIATDTIEPVDSDLTANDASPVGSIPNDTIASIPEPAIIDPRSPFELSIFGGVLFTNSSYTGGLTEDWSSTIDQEQTITGGVELMHMGRNFGIGSGLHYSTYAERITTQQLDRSETAQFHYYFLSPVDTTLLIITDSIFMNGQWQYVGQSVNTTVHVLDQGIQTNTTTTRIRDAREQVNRTSYLEIPLLLDAHVTQGRWSLGLRGGPTLGVLTMRRGSVPNSDAGYLDLAEQEMRSLVFGYTARAYIRHRFNAGWSIGLEPMIGGHLINSFTGDDLVRKPSAFGGMMSLGYRFR